jgi:3'(2'), 5'-bisphosphate nucleotidase
MKINSKFINKLLSFGDSLSKVVLDIQSRDFEVSYKSDQSPLTEADTISNEMILNFLRSETSVSDIISEENKSVPYESRKDWDYYWLIDPIDGTKEFSKGGDDFCINIALCKGDEPVFGYVARPATGDQYYAIQGRGAFKNGERIITGRSDRNNLRVVASKSHMNDETKNFVENLSDSYGVSLVNVGSSLKFCLIAEGEADIYPRFGPTMEWDTCAPQIIAEESGADVFLASNLLPMSYNKESLLNPFFIVTNTNIK